MKMTKVLFSLMLTTVIAFAQNYHIDWYVIGSGGEHSQSADYQLDGTIGQPIVGQVSSANYIIEAGFWVGAGALSGYEYLPGDANMANGAWPPAVIGSDVTYLVNYFRGMPTNPACLVNGFYCAADVNADCRVIGSDVTRLVNFFRGLGSIEPCPDYPPAWLTPADCPAEAPAGWPNCEAPPVNGKNIKTGPQKD